MYRGAGAAATSQEAADFWVEDATGRVLVRARALEVGARAERQERVLIQADKDIHAVSNRQRELKQQIQAGRGDVPAAQREQRRLAQVATLMCAVRAQARGRVHIGDSPDAQTRWIAEHADIAKAGPGAETVRLAVEQWEVVLEEGYEVEVEGVSAREQAPPGSDGGYRDSAMCSVLRPGSTGAVTVRALGDASVENTIGPNPLTRQSVRSASSGGAPSDLVPPVRAGRASPMLVAFGLFLVFGAAGALAWWLSR